MKNTEYTKKSFLLPFTFLLVFKNKISYFQKWGSFDLLDKVLLQVVLIAFRWQRTYKLFSKWRLYWENESKAYPAFRKNIALLNSHETHKSHGKDRFNYTIKIQTLTVQDGELTLSNSPSLSPKTHKAHLKIIIV